MKFRNGVSLFSNYVNNDIILNGHYVSCETFVDDACIHVSSVFYETDLLKYSSLPQTRFSNVKIYLIIKTRRKHHHCRVTQSQ